MTDIRDILARAVGPAPALRGADEVLTVARAAARRRTRQGAAGTALACLVMVALVVGVGTVRTHSKGAGAPTPASTGSVRLPADLPPVPSSRADNELLIEHLAVRLAGAVPAGLAAIELMGLGAEPPVHEGQSNLLAGAYLVVSRGNGQGELFAVIDSDAVPAPAGDLCAAGATRLVASADSCRVVVVNGVPIQLTTADYPGVGRQIVATRFLRGGHLYVGARSAVPPLGSLQIPWPVVDPAGGQASVPLAEPVLTAERLAQLAADPAALSP
jgi:hypothetical protein